MTRRVRAVGTIHYVDGDMRDVTKMSELQVQFLYLIKRNQPRRNKFSRGRYDIVRQVMGFTDHYRAPTMKPIFDRTGQEGNRFVIIERIDNEAESYPCGMREAISIGSFHEMLLTHEVMRSL